MHSSTACVFIPTSMLEVDRLILPADRINKYQQPKLEAILMYTGAPQSTYIVTACQEVFQQRTGSLAMQWTLWTSNWAGVPQQNKGLFLGSLLLVRMVSRAMIDGLAHLGTATLICVPQLDRCEVCQFTRRMVGPIGGICGEVVNYYTISTVLIWKLALWASNHPKLHKVKHNKATCLYIINTKT